jgi:hypothetical protein
MKSLVAKGNIKMLSENEIGYLKRLLKQDNEQWEKAHVLNDLYRHCKYTIRCLTRQLSGVDNKKIFKTYNEVNRTTTLFMIYRAEQMYSAVTDCQQLFRHMATVLYDQDHIGEILIRDEVVKKVTDEEK